MHSQSSISSFLNVCRHRSASLVSGSGSCSTSIVCPFHRWAYDLEGRCLGTPGFTEDLRKYPLINGAPLTTSHGLIWNKTRSETIVNSLKSSGVFDGLDLEQYVFMVTEIDHCYFNWKLYVEVFLDDNHINFIHPGLRDIVDIKTLQWEFNDAYSIQLLNFKEFPERIDSTTVRSYMQAAWHKKIARNIKCVRWVFIYPNILIEIYIDAMIISYIVPNEVEKTTIYNYYFCHKDMQGDVNFSKAFIGMHTQIDDEDFVLVDAIASGRKSLLRHDISDDGPYAFSERGILNFHEYLYSSCDLYGSKPVNQKVSK